MFHVVVVVVIIIITIIIILVIVVTCRHHGQLMLMSRVYASIIYMRMVQAIKVRTYSGPADGFAVHT